MITDISSYQSIDNPKYRYIEKYRYVSISISIIIYKKYSQIGNKSQSITDISD